MLTVTKPGVYVVDYGEKPTVVNHTPPGFVGNTVVFHADPERQAKILAHAVDTYLESHFRSGALRTVIRVTPERSHRLMFYVDPAETHEVELDFGVVELP